MATRDKIQVLVSFGEGLVKMKVMRKGEIYQKV